MFFLHMKSVNLCLHFFKCQINMKAKRVVLVSLFFLIVYNILSCRPNAGEGGNMFFICQHPCTY